MNLKGNTVLVTGGGRGIGRSLAEMFHAGGSEVIIAGRDETRLADVARERSGMHLMRLDMADSESLPRFAASVTERHPELNIVVHNAGIARAETIGEGDVPLAEEIITVNLLGVIRLNSALLPFLKARPHSVIITVSSGAAFVPRFSAPTYCASKAAIHAYTQSLRRQLEATSVEVVELIPPYVQTELGGPQQATDPTAMPLGAFISEVTARLQEEPTPKEVCVERVRTEREAEARGDYDAVFKQLNDLLT